VVVDRSTGMIESAPDDRPWLEVVEDALTRFVELPFVSDVPLALGYFPPDQDQPSTCEAPFELEVPYATASDNAELVRASLTAQMPSGDRPLDHALEGAIAIAQARPASAVRQLVAVIAAGPADACEPRTSSDCGAPVSAAGVDTALIALGAAADTPELAEPFESVAVIESDDPAGDLVHALAELVGRAVPCEITLPAPPEGEQYDPSRLNVSLRPYGAPQDQALYYVGDTAGCDDNGGEGWYYDDPRAPSRILLCDGTCDQTLGAELTLSFGCAFKVP
jgi:hypothetical protein